MDSRKQGALTKEAYWSEIWQSDRDNQNLIDPASDEYRDFHEFFRTAFADHKGRLLEIGCGGSRWLPYFARQFGFEVWGIDYSSTGCQKASAILASTRVPGTVLERDAFAPNEDLLEEFDVVVSLGLVEHFADTADAVRSLARYVKPGGLLVSTAPNLAGLIGKTQRVLNREIFEGHIPFTLERLANAHEEAGLSVQTAAYIGSLDFRWLNLHGTQERWKWISYRVLSRLTRIGWKLPISVPRTRVWSVALGVGARKGAP